MEVAHAGVPVVASDIEIFRDVGGESVQSICSTQSRDGADR